MNCSRHVRFCVSIKEKWIRKFEVINNLVSGQARATFLTLLIDSVMKILSLFKLFERKRVRNCVDLNCSWMRARVLCVCGNSWRLCQFLVVRSWNVAKKKRDYKQLKPDTVFAENVQIIKMKIHLTSAIGSFWLQQSPMELFLYGRHIFKR